MRFAVAALARRLLGRDLGPDELGDGDRGVELGGRRHLRLRRRHEAPRRPAEEPLSPGGPRRSPPPSTTKEKTDNAACLVKTARKVTNAMLQ